MTQPPFSEDQPTQQLPLLGPPPGPTPPYGRPPDHGRRLGLVIAAVLVVAALVVGGIVLAGGSKKHSSTASPATGSSSPAGGTGGGFPAGSSAGASPASFDCSDISEIPVLSSALGDLQSTSEGAPSDVPLPPGRPTARCGGAFTDGGDPALVLGYDGVSAQTYDAVLSAAGWTQAAPASSGHPAVYDPDGSGSYEIDYLTSGQHLVVIVDNTDGPSAGGGQGGGAATTSVNNCADLSRASGEHYQPTTDPLPAWLPDPSFGDRTLECQASNGSTTIDQYLVIGSTASDAAGYQGQLESQGFSVRSTLSDGNVRYQDDAGHQVLVTPPGSGNVFSLVWVVS